MGTSMVFSLFSDIDSKQPKNYIACSGNCQFFVDFSKLPIELGYCFSLNINFLSLFS